MHTHYHTRINAGVSFGLILILGSGGLTKLSPSSIPGLATLLTGWALLLYGCAHYARAKGQSEWYGLLALLFLPGMAVLTLLADKYKVGRAWVMTKGGEQVASGLPAKIPSVVEAKDSCFVCPHCGQRTMVDAGSMEKPRESRGIT